MERDRRRRRRLSPFTLRALCHTSMSMMTMDVVVFAIVTQRRKAAQLWLSRVRRGGEQLAQQQQHSQDKD